MRISYLCLFFQSNDYGWVAWNVSRDTLISIMNLILLKVGNPPHLGRQVETCEWKICQHVILKCVNLEDKFLLIYFSSIRSLVPGSCTIFHFIFAPGNELVLVSQKLTCMLTF